MSDYDQDKTYAIPMKRKQYVDDPHERPQSETQTVLVKPYPEMDGGMVGFLDPTTGKYVGCCGIFFWRENAREVIIPDGACRACGNPSGACDVPGACG